MTDMELGAKILNITAGEFALFSMKAFLITFIIKLILEDSSFKYSKLMSTIVVSIFTLFLSLQTLNIDAYYIFGIARLLIIGIILISLRDSIPKWRRNLQVSKAQN